MEQEKPMPFFTKFGHLFYKNPIAMTFGISAAAAVAALLITLAQYMLGGQSAGDTMNIIVVLLIYSVLALPAVLTVENIVFLILKPGLAERDGAAKAVELMTVFFGAFLSLFFLQFTNMCPADWNVQLYNDQLHSPFEIGSFPTLAVIALTAIAGYMVSRFVPLSKQPPLLSVLCISAMYLGIAECILWCVQISINPYLASLCLCPINCILIAVKTIRFLVTQKAAAVREQGEAPKLNRLARLLERASARPWLALLAAAPRLGVIIIILLLFGQAPDSIIRAWTNTANWNLSQQTPPPNLIRDEHYLCTVAAGGHRKVVKPLRTGKRHGHEVVVNRQLCIANAFEQLLEERAPKFHRAVRGFYDKTGYPIAKHIRSPYLADCIYFIMKPLEWVFLAVLYLFDPKPENRIAVQYPHAPVPPKH